MLLPCYSDSSKVNGVVIFGSEVRMSTKKVLFVFSFGYGLLYLLAVFCCYPFIVDYEQCFAPGIRCLVRNSIMCAGVFGKGVHIDLGLVVVF